MLQKLLNKIGYIREDVYLTFQKQTANEIRGLNGVIEKLHEENLRLRAEVAAAEPAQVKALFEVGMGDPSPVDGDARKIYVSQIAVFFKDYFKPKLFHMISVTHNMLEETSSDRDFDLILKGVVYSFREFLKWGDGMVNEAMSYQVENTPNGEATSEDVESLKDKLQENG